MRGRDINVVLYTPKVWIAFRRLCIFCESRRVYPGNMDEILRRFTFREGLIHFCVEKARYVWKFIKLFVDWDGADDFRLWPKLNCLCAGILDVSSEENEGLLDLQTDIIDYIPKLAVGQPAKFWLEVLEKWEAPAKNHLKTIDKYVEKVQRESEREREREREIRDHPSHPYENERVESHRRGYNDGRNGYY